MAKYTMQDVESLIAEIQGEFPDFKLARKADSLLMKFFDVLLKVITFGRNRDFMTDYSTTLGLTIYTGSFWGQNTPGDKVGLLRHERVHLRQEKKYGKFLFLLLYVFPFFPVGFAKWRVKFEQEAYEESMKTLVEDQGAQYLFNSDYRTFMIDQFVKSDYFWMWYKRKDIESWYDQTAQKIVDEHLAEKG